MTYYRVNLQEDTSNPFGGPAKTTPFPGWGILPRAAGPERIGVGCVGCSPDGLGAIAVKPTTAVKLAAPSLVSKVSPTLSTKIAPQAQSDTTGGGVTPTEGEQGFWQWWMWMAVPLAVGGIGLFAYDYLVPRRATPNISAHRRRAAAIKAARARWKKRAAKKLGYALQLRDIGGWGKPEFVSKVLSHAKQEAGVAVAEGWDVRLISLDTGKRLKY